MNLKPSTALRNDYPQVAALAKESGQPIVITNKGEADLVVMSVDAYERRERELEHRASILEAEFSRRPVRGDTAEAAGEPDRLPPLEEITLVDYDLAWTIEHHDSILMSWAFYLGGGEEP